MGYSIGNALYKDDIMMKMMMMIIIIIIIIIKSNYIMRSLMICTAHPIFCG